MADAPPRLVPDAFRFIFDGFSGALPNGNVVDRRLFPEAVPAQANAFMGIPPPRATAACRECPWVGEEDQVKRSPLDATDARSCPACGAADPTRDPHVS